MRRTGLALIFLLVAIPTVAHATGVTVFRTADRVVLAADSHETQWDDAGRETAAATVCKAHTAGRWWFIWGALHWWQGGPDLVGAFAATVAPVTAWADLPNAVVSFLRSHVVDLPWDRLGAAYPIGKLVFWVGIGGLDADGAPVAGIWKATRTAAGLDAGQTLCPGDCPDGRLQVGAWPASGPLEAGLSIDGPLTVARARQLLQAQIAATPTLMAPPLTIVEITPRAVTVEPGACHTLKG